LVGRKTFRPGPGNVCAERDFNTITSPNLAPDELEKALSKFEALAASALDEVTSNVLTFSSNAWVTVLNFMALLATRNPPTRRVAEKFYTEHLLRDLESATDTPEKFEATVAAARAAGNLRDDLVADYEAHRAFLAGRRFTLSFDQGFHVVGEFTALDSVLEHLARRQWTILEAPQGCGGFITSDRPVTLCFADGSPPSAERPLGYALLDTLVFFPLSPKLLAVGRFAEGRRATQIFRPAVARVERKMVAKANFTMLRQCERMVFAHRGDFEVALPGDGSVVGAAVLEVIQERVEVPPYRPPG
jgi:hypothetical protein